MVASSIYWIIHCLGMNWSSGVARESVTNDRISHRLNTEARQAVSTFARYLSSVSSLPNPSDLKTLMMRAYRPPIRRKRHNFSFSRRLSAAVTKRQSVALKPDHRCSNRCMFISVKYVGRYMCLPSTASKSSKHPVMVQ